MFELGWRVSRFGAASGGIWEASSAIIAAGELSSGSERMAKRDQFEQHFQRKREVEERHKKTLPKGDEPPLPAPVEAIRNQSSEPGRNDPCPCGSGKKFKQCCAKKAKKK